MESTHDQGADVVCLYHKDCFDGLGAAWAVWKRYPLGEFIPMDYEDPIPENLAGKHVIIVDYTLNTLQDMWDVAVTSAQFTFLDHHPKAEEFADTLTKMATNHPEMKLYAKWDKSRSGALMAWEHFHDTPVPRIIQHISDRDLWQFKLPNTAQIMAGMSCFELEIDAWEEYFRTFHPTPEGEQAMLDELAFEAGKYIQISRRTDVKRIIAKTLRTLVIGEQEIPTINVPRSLVSEALSWLAKDYPFAAGYFDTPTHREFSLRSTKESGVQVDAIAKLYGGNGHEQAAGFRVTRDHPLATA